VVGVAVVLEVGVARIDEMVEAGDAVELVGLAGAWLWFDASDEEAVVEEDSLNFRFADKENVFIVTMVTSGLSVMMNPSSAGHLSPSSCSSPVVSIGTQTTGKRLIAGAS
jgi:hypothetical protein